MLKKFSETEKVLRERFAAGNVFSRKGLLHKIVMSGKPTPKGKGECKTDLYISTETPDKKSYAFKLSVKQDNYDFLENKTSLERARQIFESSASDVIREAINKISNLFSERELITYKNEDCTYKITLGWKLEMFNGRKGKLKVEANLTNAQKMEILAGFKLDQGKRDANVEGKTIPGSGVANYVLEVPSDPARVQAMSLDDLAGNFQTIADYSPGINVDYGFTAINYRSDKDKWDGKRALAVWIDWAITCGKLSYALNFDRPLEKTSNEIGANLKAALGKAGIPTHVERDAFMGKIADLNVYAESPA